MSISNLAQPIKAIGDGVAISISLTSLVGLLTGIVGLLSAVMALVWWSIRIYETKTFQRVILNKQHTRKSDVDIEDDGAP